MTTLASTKTAKSIQKIGHEINSHSYEVITYYSVKGGRLKRINHQFMPKLGWDVFTTGQIAKIFCVAPRTVASWMDKKSDGKRLSGYRIPAINSERDGSDRRFTREDAIDFAKRNGIPIPVPLLSLSRIAAVYCDDRIESASGEAIKLHQMDPLSAGMAIRGYEISSVVVGTTDGLGSAFKLIESVLGLVQPIVTVFLADDDVPEERIDAKAAEWKALGLNVNLFGFTRSPANIVKAVNAIRGQ